MWWRGRWRRRRRQTQDPSYLIERAAARCVEADTGSHVLPTYQVLPVTNSSRRPTSFQTNPLHSTVHVRLCIHPAVDPRFNPHPILSPHPKSTKAKKKGGTYRPFLFLFSLFSSHSSLRLYSSHSATPSIHHSPSRLNDLRQPAHHTHPLVHHSQPPTNGQSPIGDFSVRHCIPALLGNSPCKALRVKEGTSTV